MKIRRFLHVLAVAFSSLAAMLFHWHADPAGAKKTKKSGQDQLAKTASPRDNGSDEPPPSRLAALIPLNTAGAVASGNSEKTRYPWKQKIVTTTFWVGETPTKNNPVPNKSSSWDKDWAADFGGFDNPDPRARKDFIPVNFTPRLNPFYVALPYNDLDNSGLKADASKVIPWFQSDYQGPQQSVCKDRWVAIRFNNKVVYAQWEDCGPYRTDHWEYVFGDERPKPNMNHGAGMDVSPAVRDYLGMNDTDVTDWRFVDFDEVPQGPWSKFGENNPFVLNQRVETQRLAVARDKVSQQNE